MFFVRLLTTASIVAIVSAAPNADAIPWAKANPQAAAAAAAYAAAYAEAEAIGHADPEAYAMAASEDQCANIACHASCGLMIIEGQACSRNTENDYLGPHDTDCLCASDSAFMSYYPSCMDCGWTLWKYYGPYVTDALRACPGLSTEPTGTTRCSTTLTDIYTPDYGLRACEYTGGCDEVDATATTATTADATTETDEAEDTTAPTTQTEETAAPTTQTEETPESPAEETAEAPVETQSPITTAEAPADTAAAGEEEEEAATITTSDAAADAATSAAPDAVTEVAAEDTAADVGTTAPAVETFEGKASFVGVSVAAVVALLFI